MFFAFRKIPPCFVATVDFPDRLRLRDAVLVFRDQPFTDEVQLAFARRLDGELHTRTGARVTGQEPARQRGVADISNLDEDDVMKSEDRAG